MTKLLQVSNYYPPDVGGIENVARAVSAALRGCCTEEVLCFSHTRKGSREVRDGTKVTRCGTQVRLFSQQLSVRMPGLMRAALRGGRPDAVIVHAPNPFLEFLVLRYIPAGTRLIVWWHSDIVRQKLGDRVFRGMTRRLLARADAVAATSPNYVAGSRYLTEVSGKCTVIPNCVDTGRFAADDSVRAAAERIRTAHPGRIILAAVGRQVPYKGFVHLMRAMRLLDDRFILYLIGREGTATAQILREKESDPRMGGRVIMTGELPQEEIRAYLTACDIFCFPSVTRNEAFGLALAEAMYLGRPAVTFTVPGSGVNYVSLSGVTGLEVPNGDDKAFAEAILRLADDPALRGRLGQNAALRARELFLPAQFEAAVRRLVSGEGREVGR